MVLKIAIAYHQLFVVHVYAPSAQAYIMIQHYAYYCCVVCIQSLLPRIPPRVLHFSAIHSLRFHLLRFSCFGCLSVLFLLFWNSIICNTALVFLPRLFVFRNFCFGKPKAVDFPGAYADVFSEWLDACILCGTQFDFNYIFAACACSHETVSQAGVVWVD